MQRRSQTRSRRDEADGSGALVGYLPVGFPDLDDQHRRGRRAGRERRRRPRARPAVLRPGHGRPGHPEGDPGRRSQTASASATFHGRRGGPQPRRRARARDDLLEPRACGSAWSASPTPARRRGSRAHHARPHPRRGRRLDRGQRAHRARPGVPRRAVLHRRTPAATVEASRGFVYAVSTMGITGARADVDAAARDRWSPACATAGRRPAPASASASPPPTRSPRCSSYADGAIVGSALVTALADGGVDGVARAAAVAAHAADRRS